MKHITFYLDFISPYAYLAFEKLPETLEGLSYTVAYKPVLFGAMLKANGQLGPAEIASKRAWTYRHVLWLGHAHGVPLEMPATHPFNPLPHLRLALATSSGAAISRYVAEMIFHEVWRGGAEMGDAVRLAGLAEALDTVRDGNGAEAKAQLKANTDEALARGVFGVPAYAVDDKLFWGFDGLAMLRAYLDGDAWFDSPAWSGAAERPGLVRQNR
ncbi:2-hydroxychromene-2-carboxylate isomerase [Variovorax sp. PAMC 28711]|uniref:2-hydroxychromene-2-carboxylate isomerase n=1 Tax=Variovorax sp. PAMC 28711 TaxID=1795631 RepID=UPI00078EAF77|nr:2-hydroxychromene-2-carboxylate isomerase [Variovorax sp. PAMC 28711]AMM25236.1 disulfide bond formation protein DsbA [Variovorax sp. PAMC 28711]